MVFAFCVLEPKLHLDAAIDVMDISGQQQMGVISRIVKIDLDKNRKPINIAQSSALAEVFFCFLHHL